MANSPGQSTALHTLFADLQRCGISGDYEKGIKIANKILNQEPKNLKAFECKIVSNIQLSKFDNALRDIDQANSTNKPAAGSEPTEPHFSFEKAYCLYRMNQVTESYDVLRSIDNPDYRTKELTAQVLYRLEKFQEAYNIYVELIKNSSDEFESERWTNLAAVMANLPQETQKSLPEIDEETIKTYELRYNKACVLLAGCRLEEAKSELEQSEKEGRQTLEEEGATEEEIETDLALIRAQLGYVYQSMGRDDMALKLYNQVLKQKLSDVALVAVASNNVVSINREQNVFDSKKKLKSALAELETNKLSSVQKRTILYNNALLLLHMNQRDASRKQLDQLLAQSPESKADVALVQAALFVREKKLDNATELLSAAIKDHPNHIPLCLALAQILLMQGHVSKSCDTLKSMGATSYRLGVLSTLVSLYLSLSDKASVISILSDCVAKFRKEKRTDKLAVQLMQENAKFFLDDGQPEKAIELLEDLRKIDPQNLKLLSQLISAYSQVDKEKAKKVSQELPAIEDIIKAVDVDTLESTSWSLGTKYARKLAGASGAGDKPVGPEDATDRNGLKKRSKKKKKRPLPKNYDPTCDPDPERWLPKWQRSTFKNRKRDKRGAGAIGKGTQGSTAEVEIPIPKKPTTQAAPAQGPRQQRPGVQKNKKKGKGKK